MQTWCPSCAPLRTGTAQLSAQVEAEQPLSPPSPRTAAPGTSPPYRDTGTSGAIGGGTVGGGGGGKGDGGNVDMVLLGPPGRPRDLTALVAAVERVRVVEKDWLAEGRGPGSHKFLVSSFLMGYVKEKAQK